jgi:hypothetical protein
VTVLIAVKVLVVVVVVAVAAAGVAMVVVVVALQRTVIFTLLGQSADVSGFQVPYVKFSRQSGYELGDEEIEIRVPVRSRTFSSPRRPD